MTFQTRFACVWTLICASFMIQSASAQSLRPNRRLTQVTVLPSTPTAAMVQPAPANQGGLRWQTNRPLIQSGYTMPTRPLFISGYGGRNYGRGVRQGYIPASPGSAQGDIKMIELSPLR